jgi:hypothetical protein
VRYITLATRQHANLHQPSANVTKYQKGVHYTGVMVFNMLSIYIKTVSDNLKKFKVALQKFLCKLLFIPWMNSLNSKKFKYLHTIWLDIWKFWHVCSFFFFTNLYRIVECRSVVVFYAYSTPTKVAAVVCSGWAVLGRGPQGIVAGKSGACRIRCRNECMNIWGMNVSAVLIAFFIQGVPGGKDLTSGECSLGQTIPI